MFNQRNWSVQNEIQKRVEIESLQEWASEPSFTPPKPRYEPSRGPHKHVNWHIFFKNFVYQFRP